MPMSSIIRVDSEVACIVSIGFQKQANAFSCYDEADAVPAQMKGYHDSQRDFKALNGHGYDDSTHLKGVDKKDYVAGYHMGWEDAKIGKSGPFC